MLSNKPSSIFLKTSQTSSKTMPITPKSDSEVIDTKKRSHEDAFTESLESAQKKEKISLREISSQELFQVLKEISYETGRPLISFETVENIYSEYKHKPTRREWLAHENRLLASYLQKLGFNASVIELNKMLPDGTVNVEEANLFVWETCADDLNCNKDIMYANQEKVEKDKVKWSRRASKYDKNGNLRNGLQNKNARHNSCITDLEEPIVDHDNTIIGENYVKHPHPKNPDIKYTNYGFDAFPELKKFRWRLAAILGPFGYKVFGQYFELNHYYDRLCGIGRHGDIERGNGDSRGMVNCLKLGYSIPLLFSWYYKCKPVGLHTALPSESIGIKSAHFPLVEFKGGKKDRKWTTSTVAAVVKLGHGNYYQMSAKAIGKDWKSSSKYTLRHCAGASKYTGLHKQWSQKELKELDSAYSLTGSDRVENDSESPELQFSTKYDGM